MVGIAASLAITKPRRTNQGFAGRKSIIYRSISLLTGTHSYLEYPFLKILADVERLRMLL